MQVLHDPCEDQVGNRRIRSCRRAAAVAGGPNRHLGACEGSVEKPFDMHRFDRLAPLLDRVLSQWLRSTAA
jgi:hypothetical protein